MMELIVVCATAVICSIILAGGVNRAAWYLSQAVHRTLDEHLERQERLLRNIIDIKEKLK
jgi:hypothetical protein